MRVFLPLLLGLALVALVVWHVLRTPAAVLARQVYLAGGVALILAAAVLAFLREFAIAVPVLFVGLALLRRQRGMRVTGPTGKTSQVRSAGLEMRLDHDTGEMDGLVLAGRHEGKKLSELSLSELLESGEDVRGDPESLRLLESYLDRAYPGWRDDVQAHSARRESAAPGAGGMSTKEAYQILGLEPGASETEVRDAHRRLIKQVHPDRGGSAALAAKINEAKDKILRKHG